MDGVGTRGYASVPPLGLGVGMFVWAPTPSRLGQVVAIDLDHGSVSVRFRHSTVRSEQQSFPARELDRAYLSRHTRVYVRDGLGGKMRPGRVIEPDRAQESLAYLVRVQGGSDQVVLERDLEVRSFAPTIDPTDVLAGGAAESQYLFDRRIGARRAMLALGAASAGVQGLVSASVDLLPHQFEVVRRVLDDPVQRYLLADEVGLGKTIEAGAILRQSVIDRPSARAAVVCPDALAAQWQRELAAKFDLLSDEQVDFYTPGTLVQLVRRAEEYETLVVDEVHHLIADPRALGALQVIASKTPRVLLLSATPALADEALALSSLHLLDPLAYPLEETEAFHAKFEQRQRFGSLLMALDPEAPVFLLRSTLAQLGELASGDELLAELAAKITDSETDSDARRRVVMDLRQHIASTYRLHHRLVRTRRVAVDWPERRCEVTVEVDDDDRTSTLWSLLEEWRTAALDSERRGEAVRIFAGLFAGLGAGADALLEVLDAREAELDRGANMCFAEEREWVTAARSACADNNEGSSRLELARDAMELALRPRRGEPPQRFVAYVTSRSQGEELAELLDGIPNVVVCSILAGCSDEEAEETLDEFFATDRAAILVCDPSGEEGLNLQRADGMMHVDLPFSLSRLEQRIGRLDRYGRVRPEIKTRVCIPTDDQGSPWAAWVTLLQEAFGLFRRSISDVQFLLDSIEDQLREALFERGAGGLLELAEPLRQQLADERQRLDEQGALDQLDLGSTVAIARFRVLQQAEQRAARLGEDFDEWAFRVLQLHRHRVDLDTFVAGWDERRTLLPATPWRNLLLEGLDRPVTHVRAVATASGARLIRPGFALFDETERMMRRDDRGTAFATLRADDRWPSDEPWLGFHLAYETGLDEDLLRNALTRAGVQTSWSVVRRQARAYFPAWLQEIRLDANLDEVRHPLALELMRRSYRDPDVNLSSRPELFEQVIDAGQFSQLCGQIRARSEELVRASAAFVERCERQVGEASERLELRALLLERRAKALASQGQRDTAIEQEILIARAIGESVRTPQTRLEAIGCIVLTRDRAAAL